MGSIGECDFLPTYVATVALGLGRSAGGGLESSSATVALSGVGRGNECGPVDEAEQVKHGLDARS